MHFNKKLLITIGNIIKKTKCFWSFVVELCRAAGTLFEKNILRLFLDISLSVNHLELFNDEM